MIMNRPHSELSMTIFCSNFRTHVHVPSLIRYLAFSIPFLGGYACRICRLLRRCCLVSGHCLIDSLPPRFLRDLPCWWLGHPSLWLIVALSQASYEHRKVGLFSVHSLAQTLMTLYCCYLSPKMNIRPLTRAIHHISQPQSMGWDLDHLNWVSHYTLIEFLTLNFFLRY